MDEDDRALRNLTYARFIEFGRAPMAAEVAQTAVTLSGASATYSATVSGNGNRLILPFTASRQSL